MYGLVEMLSGWVLMWLGDHDVGRAGRESRVEIGIGVGNYS